MRCRLIDRLHNLRQKAARLEVRKNFFSNRVIDSWNQLPSQVKNMKTVSSFKHGLQNLQKSRTGTSHIKEYENGDEMEKWRGQLNKNTSCEAPAGPLKAGFRIRIDLIRIRIRIRIQHFF
jgi:hypothetical protein